MIQNENMLDKTKCSTTSRKIYNYLSSDNTVPLAANAAFASLTFNEVLLDLLNVSEANSDHVMVAKRDTVACNDNLSNLKPNLDCFNKDFITPVFRNYGTLNFSLDKLECTLI
jgi:hypothetical protein